MVRIGCNTESKKDIVRIEYDIGLKKDMEKKRLCSFSCAFY